MNINIGDLVTLRGLSQLSEKPIGLVRAMWPGSKKLKVDWLNVELANRFALQPIMEVKKLEIVSGV